MGLFDIFRKKKQTEKTAEVKEISANNAAEESVVIDGWIAIEKAFEELYPGQSNPKHYGTLIKWRLGGNDPLDGISIYDDGDYWHFITFGLSELYEKESDDAEVSGYGMEFTLRLKKGYGEDEEAEIRCICGVLQQIARLTFTSGEIFNAYEYLYTGQKTGMDVRQLSALTGFITVPDTKLAGVATPNGKVELVEFIGVTDAELTKLVNKELTVRELYQMIGSDITDYNRNSVV